MKLMRPMQSSAPQNPRGARMLPPAALEMMGAIHSHLESHCQCHLLAFEPLGEDLRHVGAFHLAAAAEDHEAQRCHFGAGGHFHPPASEPLGEARGLEPVADTHELDGGAGHHQACRQYAGEAYSQLVEYNAGQDEEAADVEYVFRCCIFAEYAAVPAQIALNERFKRTHNVHEHIREEHHQRYQHQYGPPRQRRIIHQFCNLFRHNRVFYELAR